jgi:cytochrome b561
MARTALNTRDPEAGYSALSIAIHWLTAVAVIALFLTHEDDAVRIHIGLGIIATPLFIFRFGWRFARGYPRPADQPVILNFAARLVMFAFLVCLLLVIATGFLIPPLEGKAMPFFGLAEFAIPIPPDEQAAYLVEEIHEFSGYAFIPLLALHVLGALKHHFIDKDAVLMRMLRPVSKGK